MKFESTQKFIIHCIENNRGDDLQRAQHAFKGLDMSQKPGRSRQTRQQILDRLLAHNKECDDAIVIVKQCL